MMVYSGFEIPMVTHGNTSSPHSGHGSPGRNAPGMNPHFKHIDDVTSSVM